MLAAFGEPTGQGWTQVGELAVAFVLSLVIGLEREAQQKSAGMRTYSLVGMGSALFVLISKYGFTDVLVNGRVTLDPSRVAAQIVTGLGFIGGGLIFVRRDAVRGLTTAASVWVTAAVGAAAGAGLPVLAVFTTGMYFLVLYGSRPISRWLHRFQPDAVGLQITYLDGLGVLRDAVHTTTEHGFAVAELTTVHSGPAAPHTDLDRDDRHDRDLPEPAGQRRTVDVTMVLTGRGDLPGLTSALSEIRGVLGVRTGTARFEE